MELLADRTERPARRPRPWPGSGRRQRAATPAAEWPCPAPRPSPSPSTISRIRASALREFGKRRCRHSRRPAARCWAAARLGAADGGQADAVRVGELRTTPRGAALNRARAAGASPGPTWRSRADPSAPPRRRPARRSPGRHRLPARVDRRVEGALRDVDRVARAAPRTARRRRPSARRAPRGCTGSPHCGWSWRSWPLPGSSTTCEAHGRVVVFSGATSHLMAPQSKLIVGREPGSRAGRHRLPPESRAP